MSHCALHRSPYSPPPIFFLSISSSVIVPISINDVSESLSGSPSLDIIIKKSPKGLPGKFYQYQFALALLDTVRTGGSAGRIAIDIGAEDNQRQNFERFRSRLEKGDLVCLSLSCYILLIHVCCLSHQFVAMAGTDVLAFCSSGNLLIAQRLNVPSMLLSVPGDMLVSRVVIENHSAYTDAVLRDNNDSW
jgi:hypothetical protein